MDRKTILLTGASGFVGQRYITYNQDRYSIKSISLRSVKVADINFNQIDAVLHLAGKAHQMQKIDPQIYFDVNYGLTKQLADAAKAAGVTHFVFTSTIKVFGEYQKGVLSENSPCEPVNDPYGESKLKAEKYLQSIANDQFKVAIVRPPLIYGPAVKGNLIRFLHLGNSPWYLPFARIENRRTMVFIDNLIELFNRIIDTQGEGVFLAGDREPMSTTTLITEIRKGLGKSPKLFAMPTFLIQLLKALKPQLAIRLYGSLEMNTSSTNKRLNFEPPYTISEGIKVMVDDFLAKK